ncbi:hypothetical protein V8C42DRAFT_317931 [Trichoderma barbatum]
MSKRAVFVPMGVQAFVITENFPQSNYRFAPLIQPDYSNLRAEGLLAHDVIDELELSPFRLQARHNTRFVDLSTGQVRKERVGVYLSWTIPRVYRQGIMATKKAQADHPVAQMKAGYTSEPQTVKIQSVNESQPVLSDVKFRTVPTRYLIFRISYSRNSSTPSSEIFVLESDRIRNINERELKQVDVENVTSAFIDPSLTPAQQAEAFVGLKATLRDYKPDKNAKRRIPFTVIESANELFPDYQPHNNSVFSIHDDLGYGTSSQINDATLNYFVIGFHGESDDDPLTISDAVDEDQKPSFAQLLTACVMELDTVKTVTGLSREEFLDTKADFSTRTICHGTLRNVPFQRFNLDLQAKAPSLKLQDLVRKNHPVAIGTNTLDALLAYLRVQYAEDSTGRDATDQMLSKIVQLIVSNDNIDAQQKAEDQIATNDWIPIPSGNIWTISDPENAPGTNKGPVTPSDDDQDAIMDMNDWEACIACFERERKHLYQKLFWRWWNAMEVRGTANDKLQSSYKDAVVAIVKQLGELNDAWKAAKREKELAASKISNELKLQKISAASFGVHQDPTILFAGVTSGWPSGFDSPVKVRLSSQLSQSPNLDAVSAQLNTPGWDQLLQTTFPDQVSFIKQILPEALGSAPSSAEPISAYSTQEAFDDKQGWFPLFIEWEVEYHHIKFEHWTFQQDAEQNWCYKLRTDKTLQELPGSTDSRSFSGRTPIVPQASSALQSRLKQLFSRANPQDQKADASSLLDKVSLVEYFSAPLAGIRHHLTTLIQGTHIRPHHDDQLARDFGVSKSDLDQVISHSERAPYGRIAQLKGEVITEQPFKPVTHGQFLFTKMHIVDKFGQIVSCIEPATFNSPRSALYPCISSQFFCDPIPKSKQPNDASPWPNTAHKADNKAGLCQFFQVPPRINQEARLNATFVVEEEGQYYPIDAWDNPIWGWVMVNNLDKSLLVFNADGFFLREVCILIDSNTTSTISPPSYIHGGKSTKKLDNLLDKLKSFPYALGLLTMLEAAYQATSSSTAEHADFLPAAFGRAFCLADFGCSIELAAPALENQSLQYPAPPEMSLESYKFPVRLGNADAGFDGLAGYWNTKENMENIYSEFGDERNLEKDAPGAYANPVLRFSSSSLELSPYFISAMTPDFAEAQRAKLQLRSAIFDPMRPLHVYSGGLFPMMEIALPKWAVGSAMKEMHAFFAAGPLLVPQLPPAGEMHTETVDPAASAPKKGVQMPVSGLDAWSWLQARPPVDLNDQPIGQPIWGRYPVRPVDDTLDLTASGDKSEFVEGFFLMKKSLQEAAQGGAAAR